MEATKCLEKLEQARELIQAADKETVNLGNLIGLGCMLSDLYNLKRDIDKTIRNLSDCIEINKRNEEYLKKVGVK